MGLFSWIVLGFLAGLAGGMVTGARQARGCLPRIVVGVLGALIGGALARAARIGDISGGNPRSDALPPPRPRPPPFAPGGTPRPQPPPRPPAPRPADREPAGP